jgi:hypothetical protein
MRLTPGATQELANAKSLGQRVDFAGRMGRNYRGESILGCD